MSDDDIRTRGSSDHDGDMPAAEAGRSDILLVARAAVGAAPLAEMHGWAEAARALRPAARVAFGFVEQGAPSLRSALADLRAEGVREVLVVPLLLPFDPALRNSLARMVARWRTSDPGPWPDVRIGEGWAPEGEGAAALLCRLIGSAAAAAPVPGEAIKPEGSLAPSQRYRVLVCAGGPCTQAGALLLWGHLRARQDAWKLRQEGAGMMSCRTTCLGPCALAPVMQVWPDGVTYGGLDEAGIDAVLTGHVIGGAPVEALRYAPTGRKQRLRGAEGGR